jgi:uncharacterized protein (DUF983 family)
MSTPSNPWGSLDPATPDGPDRPEPLYPDVSTWRSLARGLRKRCPRCGVGGVFSGWFTLRTSCPRCDLRFEREEGGFLGAMVLNFGVAVGLWMVVFFVWVAMTVPNIPVAPLIAMSVVVLVLVPLWFYPRSKTLWAAVEFMVLKTDPDYRAPVKRDPRARDLE